MILKSVQVAMKTRMLQSSWISKRCTHFLAQQQLQAQLQAALGHVLPQMASDNNAQLNFGHESATPVPCVMWLAKVSVDSTHVNLFVFGDKETSRYPLTYA